MATETNKGADIKTKKATPGKATILALGKAFPEQLIMQETLVDGFLRRTKCNDPEARRKLTLLSKRTTVRRRYMVLTEEMVEKNPELTKEGQPSLTHRLRIANEAVTEMALRASKDCLRRWELPASSITHLIYVSSSEARFPAGDLYLSVSLSLRRDVRRHSLSFLGCSGGVAGLRLAKDLAESNPGSRILLVTSETTVVGFRPPSRDRPYGLVGAALFGDGSGAAVIGADPMEGKEKPMFELRESMQEFVEGTEGVIDGRLSEEGVSFELGRELPMIIEDNVEGFCTRLLLREAEVGLELGRRNEMFWAVHPGGPAIMERVEKRLGLEGEKLGASRRALRDYGNAGSNTIIYVLENMVDELKNKEGGGCEWGVILAFGPGVTFEGILAKSLII